MREPVGGADDHDLRTDPHRVGVTELRHLHGRRHALELQERDIGGRIGRDQRCAHDLAANALDGDLVHGVDDVSGRHHPAAAGDQDPGARLLEAGDAAGADVASLAADHDHGRVDLAKDLLEVLGPGRRGEGGQRGGREHDCENLLHRYAFLAPEVYA
jgi:hypothetical protein